MAYKASLIAHTIYFRHPHVPDNDGRPSGKIITCRLKKLRLSAEVEGKLLDGITSLLHTTPKFRADVKDNKIPDLAKDFYFGAMDAEAQRLVDEKGEHALEVALNDPNVAPELVKKASNVPHGTEMLQGAVSLYETVIANLKRELALTQIKADESAKLAQAAKSRLDGISTAAGILNDDQKLITLEQALAKVKATIQCESLRAKKDFFVKVEPVLKHIGLLTPCVAVRKEDILKAVEAVVPIPESMSVEGKKSKGNERSYKLRDQKRFWRELEHSDFKIPNPTVMIKPGTPKSQKIVRQDPRDLLALEKLSPYWKAFVASLGLAGMRLGEAASLEWDMLDFEKKIIDLHESEHYPELKSVNSARYISPFSQFWDYMKAHKENATHAKLVFPKIIQRISPKHGSVDHWFNLRGDKPVATDLPGALADALTLAGKKTDKPAQRLRKFFQTELEARNLGGLLKASAGNTEDVRREHYLESKRIIEEAAKLGTVGAL